MKGMRLGVALVLGLAVVALGLAIAPYLYTETMPVLARHGWAIAPGPGIRDGALPGPMKGTVVGGRWRVEQIAPDTYALGEPANAPDNYEYLLVGTKRALLIDAGSTGQDIHPVLETLTKLPVTVIPTHLHYDHSNGLRNFSSIALLDVPETRSRVRDGMVHLSRYEYVGWYLQDPLGPFRVTEWVNPDNWIDLGGREVQVLWTPGHTATSISVWDPGKKLLFSGDYMYPTSLYVFQPDSSLGAYQRTANRLLGMLPEGTVIYGAHCCRNDAPVEAPWLGLGDLKDLRDAVVRIRSGKEKGRGLVVERYAVNPQMTMITVWPFGNR
jgi:glyoxylase-like metal-dependent hydrolase (beta-lactamase superfamily II)